MERDRLAELIALGLSTAQIAAELGSHPKIVAGWIREFGLETSATVRRRQDQVKPGTRRRGTCKHHGEVELVRRSDGSWRCVPCRSAQVSEARRRRKAKLVEEAGGRCARCGYDRCAAALQFHHVDPTTKLFSIAHRGASRSLEAMRAEAAKCVLLCSNCHAEVGFGLVEMPIE